MENNQPLTVTAYAKRDLERRLLAARRAHQIDRGQRLLSYFLGGGRWPFGHRLGGDELELGTIVAHSVLMAYTQVKGKPAPQKVQERLAQNMLPTELADPDPEDEIRAA